MRLNTYIHLTAGLLPKGSVIELDSESGRPDIDFDLDIEFWSSQPAVTTYSLLDGRKKVIFASLPSLKAGAFSDQEVDLNLPRKYRSVASTLLRRYLSSFDAGGLRHLVYDFSRETELRNLAKTVLTNVSKPSAGPPV